MATQQIKDILDTEVPKPSFVLSPSVPAPLPSEMPFGESGTGTGRSGKDNVARTLDPYSGKFKHVPEDTPRVYGSDQSLLVEAAGRTNRVRNSADASSWNLEKNASRSPATSIFKNKTAQEVSGSQTNSRISENAGQFSSGTETISFIAERATAPRTRFVLIDNTASTYFLYTNYDWSDDTFSHSTAPDVANTRVLANSGPNGNKIVRFIFQVSGMTSGNNALLKFAPDPTGTGSTIFHHAQIEEAPNASSPIVTTSSAKTRAGDDYKINIGDWWNPNEGTFIIKAQIPAYAQNNVYFLTQGSDQKYRYLYTSDNNSPYTLSSFDGSNLINSSNNVDPFEFFTYGVSFTGSKITASLNGVSSKTNHNKNLLLNDNKVIGINDNLIANIGQIIYYPRALPESTLNTLTT